jgi:hypothetical protein
MDNTKERKHAIMDTLIGEGIGLHYSFGNKTENDIATYIRDISSVLNDMIPTFNDTDDLHDYLMDFKNYIITHHVGDKSADFMPNINRMIQFVEGYNKMNKYGERYERWELPKGTQFNPPNDTLYYDDELKAQWQSMFPYDVNLALKSFAPSIHNNKRIYAEEKYIRALIKLGFIFSHNKEV